MPRKKNHIVEGITLDLTDLMSDTDIVAILAKISEHKDPEPPVSKIKKELIKSDEEILNSIESYWSCSVCKRGMFYVGKIWKCKRVCENCHAISQNDIPQELSSYIKEIYGSGCTFCNDKHGRFHLDHINMFSKVSSVGEMMDRGDSADDIIVEISKCQLLCINCHTLVTRFEAKRGFIKQKKLLNKKISAGDDVSEIRKNMFDEYEALMTKIYPLIREKCVHRGESLQGK